MREGCWAVVSGLFFGGGVICVHVRVYVCACVCPRLWVGVGEFEGSVVNPCVMLALALLCRGHPLSFVAGLFRVERGRRKKQSAHCELSGAVKRQPLI